MNVSRFPLNPQKRGKGALYEGGGVERGWSMMGGEERGVWRVHIKLDSG